MGTGLSLRGALPELGPHLGRLCTLPSGDGVPALDDVRLALATGVLELAGAARAFDVADRAAVVAALRRREWLAHWDQAVEAATARTVAALEEAFRRAAAESRFPRRRLARLRVTREERAAIHARLGAGAAPFVSALDRVDALAAAAGRAGPDGEGAFGAWWEAVAEAARRLETAWDVLEAAARREVGRWGGEVARVRSWRRPTWPLWTITALVTGAAAWLGLVLGGYLPVPAALRPFAEWWWARVPFA